MFPSVVSANTPLKRERQSDGLAPVSAKRVYRLMKKH